MESSLVQLLETGVMHADPHPGNLLFTKDGNLTYLDFGLICHMEKSHQAAMLAAIAHLVNGEWGYLANDLGDMDVLKPTTDRFALRLVCIISFRINNFIDISLLLLSPIGLHPSKLDAIS